MSMRTFVAALSDQVATLRRNKAEFDTATVVAVTNGAAVDGNALCTVDWRGGEIDAHYNANYAPVVGHNVGVIYQNGVLTVLCRLIGTP